MIDDALFTIILDRIAEGESLRTICKTKGMPHRATVDRFLLENPEAAAKHARAREAQADHMDAIILETANDTLSGKYEPNAARVAIGAFQWRASRLWPKRYGDKQILSNDPDNPIPPLIVIGAKRDGESNTED